MVKMMRDSNKTGFTLIELLVTVAVIGLIVSIVLANLVNARKKAGYSKAAEDLHTMQIAIEEYYGSHNDYPLTGPVSVNTSDNWDSLIASLQTYLSSSNPLGFPSIGSNAGLTQGYSYARGTPTVPQEIKTSNSANGQFVACLYLYQGYYLDFDLPEQSVLTLNDNGIDPDGIEVISGDYTISYNPSDCAF